MPFPGNHPPSLFVDRVSLAWNSLSRIGRLSRNFKGCTCFLTCHHTWLIFKCILKIEPMFFVLSKQPYYWLSYSCLHYSLTLIYVITNDVYQHFISLCFHIFSWRNKYSNPLPVFKSFCYWNTEVFIYLSY